MAGIKLNLKGFDELLEKVKRAGGNVDEAAMKAVSEGAKVAERALISEASASGVPGSVTGEITTEIEQKGNRTSAKVGWKKGAYDPRNPSAAYKAIFLNYGTPKDRHTKKKTHVLVNGSWVTTSNRGKLEARGFIDRAQKKARPQIKKAQEEVLDELFKELK